MEIPIEIALEQYSDYCYICVTKLEDKNISAQHYSSKRHKKNFAFYQKKLLDLNRPENTPLEIPKKIVMPVKATEKETLHCNNVHFDSNAAIQHYQGNEHKEKEEGYCTFCSVRTPSRNHLSQHIQGSKHKKKLKELGFPAEDEQYSPSDQTLPLSLRLMMQLETCQVCNKKIPHVSHAVGHYKSKNHKASVQRWIKERGDNEKLDSTNKSDINLFDTAKNIVQQNIEVGPANMVTYDCYACKMRVSVKSTEDNHKTDFPHTELIKLKSDMVSKGIIQEYWVRQNSSVICKLCDVQVCTVPDADVHFDSTSHRLSLYIWCQSLTNTKIPSLTDTTKWFYCNICDKALDGTSGAEKHYLAPPHKKRSALYCKVCDVRNETEAVLDFHYTTKLHVENWKKTETFLQKNDVQKVMASNPLPPVGKSLTETQSLQKTKDTEITKTQKHYEDLRENKNSELPCSSQTIKLNFDKTNTAVKEQIITEIEKLVDTLYYSKTVPYEAALKFLKKANEEAENLKKKYEKKEERQMSVEGATCSKNSLHVTMDFGEDSINGLSRASASLEIEEASSEEEFCSFKDGETLSAEVQPAGDLNHFSDDLPAARVAGVENVLDQVQSDLEHVSYYYSLLPSGLTDDVTESGLEEFNDTVSPKIKKKRNKKKKKPVKQLDYVNQVSPEVDPVESLLEDIILLKNQVQEKYPGEENVEKDVLTEIERLITLVISDSIPPDETLTLLGKFNMELRLQGCGAQEEEKEEVQSEDLDECMTRKARTDLKHRYSTEELISLRTDKTFTGIQDARLRSMLNETRLWNKQWNDLDLD